MILMYALAAWIGGAVTAVILWKSAGPLLAIMLAPFGGSALALCVALWIYFLQAPARLGRQREDADPRHWRHLVR